MNEKEINYLSTIISKVLAMERIIKKSTNKREYLKELETIKSNLRSAFDKTIDEHDQPDPPLKHARVTVSRDQK